MPQQARFSAPEPRRAAMSSAIRARRQRIRPEQKAPIGVVAVNGRLQGFTYETGRFWNSLRMRVAGTRRLWCYTRLPGG
jgi:hypothetical protein